MTNWLRAFLPVHVGTDTCSWPTDLFLPWTIRSRPMWLNWVMEKSAAKDACFPSYNNKVLYSYSVQTSLLDQHSAISTYQGINISVRDQVLWILQVSIVLGQSMNSLQIELINMKITYVSCTLKKTKLVLRFWWILTLPTIPTPTLAAWIMLTSFPPSPADHKSWNIIVKEQSCLGHSISVTINGFSSWSNHQCRI